jgi:RNA polymerase sigma-70 factor (ECF subfamily)
MPDRPPLDPQVLVREADAIARLARHLLADPDRADDASQETMRIALERGPRPGFAAAAWLRGVLRNVVRRVRRSDRRRMARERAVAAGAVDSASDSTERLARRRAVIEAVLVLPEALRTTLELRFFEGLPPRAIARRLGIPAETVRSRVRRALGLLRVELDRREGGDGRRWMLALTPIAFPGAGGPLAPVPQGVPALLGGLLMAAKTKMALAVCLALLLGAVVWRVTVDSTQGEPESSAPPALATAPGAAGALDPAPGARLASVESSTTTQHLRLRVTGLVVDADGAALPGASIHAADADVLDDRTRPPDAVTDAAGRFALEREGPQFAWRVSASMRGHRTACATASAGMARDLVLRLGRRVPLWVVVVDAASGQPIEGAEVVLTTADEGGHETRSATTDAEGLASVEEPGVRGTGFEAVVALQVTAPGHIAASIVLTGRQAPSRTTRARPHRVILEGGLPLRVRAHDPEGHPVAGATVRGWSGADVGSVAGSVFPRQVAGIPTTLGSATTDERGQATLGVPARRWYVHAQHRDDAALVAGAGNPDREVEIPLFGGVTIDGVVVDEADAPVAEARVAVHWFSWFLTDPAVDRVPVVPSDMQSAFTTRTGPDGTFALAGVPRRPDGRDFSVSAHTTAGEGTAVVRVPTGVARATVRIQVRENSPGVLPEFSVRAADGTPVPGALIGIPFVYPASRTDAKGHARLRHGMNIVGMSSSVRVTAPGFASVTIAGEDVRSGGLTEVVLQPEAVLDLIVLDPARRPVPGAMVAVVAEGGDDDVAAALRDRGHPCRLADRYTDADGRARVDGLPRAPIHVEVWQFEPDAAAGASSSRDNRAVVALAEPGPAEVVLPFAPLDAARGSVVEGRVVGADGVSLSGRASAALQSADPGRGLNLNTDVLGGRFRFDGVPSGLYQLQVYGGDSSVPMLADVEVRDGADVLGLNVTSVPPGRIVGRVTAEGGANVRDLPVHAIDTRGLHHVRARATTGPDGSFVLGPLPPGPYRIELRAPVGARVPLRSTFAGTFDVKAGADVRADLDVVPAARPVVRCEDERLAARPDGPPTMDTLQSTEAQTNLVLTEPDGSTRLEFGLWRGRNETPWALAPGRYRLRVSRFPGITAAVEFDVRGPGDVEVELTLSPPPK